MTEEQSRGFGSYNPEAAQHGPYNDAMAEWRNQVRSMQEAGTLPGSPEAAVAGEPAPEVVQPPVEDSGAVQGDMSGTLPSEGQPVTDDGLVSNETVPEETAPVVPERGAAEQSEPEDDEPREVYDPARHNAPDVLEYLKGVGYDEAFRVLESEEAGRNRKGIMNLRDDILIKARNNDQTGSGSKTA